jgi:V-type H+-transporting ATPase subunit a
VSTYGIPDYKEINPAIYTTVTFPFLFGVMFGDIGHGILLFTVASLLCWFGHKFPALQDAYQARYLLLLMGLFSTFCGFMYNDFLSIPLNLFGSCYNFETGEKMDPNCVYPIGVDPVWYLSVQEISYLNSIKMKISVIFGVLHMSMGLIQKGLNSVYFQRRLETWHEFVP